MQAQQPKVTEFKVVNPNSVAVAVGTALNTATRFYPRIIKTVLNDGKTEKAFYQMSTY